MGDEPDETRRHPAGRGAAPRLGRDGHLRGGGAAAWWSARPCSWAPRCTTRHPPRRGRGRRHDQPAGGAAARVHLRGAALGRPLDGDAAGPVAEPFLLVGIIASIKEIVLIAAAPPPDGDDFDKFRDSMVEIGVLTGVVLLLSISALLPAPAPARARRRAGRADQAQVREDLRDLGGEVVAVGAGPLVDAGAVPAVGGVGPAGETSSSSGQRARPRRPSPGRRRTGRRAGPAPPVGGRTRCGVDR